MVASVSQSSTSGIQRAIGVEQLYPPGVIAFATTGEISPDHLFPSERQYLERCVPKRAREFAAGRFCARAGLKKLGVAPEPLLAAEDRTPRWPAGTVGSITHTVGYCVAVVAREGQFAAVGVDAERIDDVTASLWSLTMRPEELARLRSLDPTDRQQLAAINYSAKEAFYKCQYTLTRSWLGFEDVSVEIVADAFEVSIIKPSSPIHRTLSPWVGHFTVQRGVIITGIAAERHAVGLRGSSPGPLINQ